MVLQYLGGLDLKYFSFFFVFSPLLMNKKFTYFVVLNAHCASVIFLPLSRKVLLRGVGCMLQDRYTMQVRYLLSTLRFIIVSIDLEVQVRNGVLLSNGMRVGKIFFIPKQVSSHTHGRIDHTATFSYLEHPSLLSSFSFSGGLHIFTTQNVLSLWSPIDGV